MFGNASTRLAILDTCVHTPKYPLSPIIAASLPVTVLLIASVLLAEPAVVCVPDTNKQNSRDKIVALDGDLGTNLSAHTRAKSRARQCGT